MLKEVNKSRKHILLVDDDSSVAKMLSMLLETRGYEVRIARSGQEALEKVSTATDLILLDLILPDQGGFEVCRKIREVQLISHIPIIMLSGKLLSEDIVEGLYLGADDYLTKPFEYEELIARMEAVMRRRILLPGETLISHGQQAVIEELRKIIRGELITPFFQPIYMLDSLKLYGLEALCRPTTGSMLSNPEILFKAAIKFGFYQELELLSWKKAIQYASKYLKDEKLFLNCNPYLVEGPKFMKIKSFFDDFDIKQSNVILEITERSAIHDFKTFYNHLLKYREFGFQFAIDDVGGGYASLESIVETRPEVIKIDRHIINGLAQDKYKQSIIRFIVAFCVENNILSIAEGVETKEDLDVVRALGVNAVQGYYLYKPSAFIDLKKMSEEVSLG